MAGVADKARFYLERAAPQLRDFEEKQIFTREEIRTLVQKRSEHEHVVLAPGSKPADFLRYAAWERSFDALRAKRCRRLRIKAAAASDTDNKKAPKRAGMASALSAHPSQARTFGIFERGVTKHPGCVGLWSAYLGAAAEVGATRRWRKVVTRALRLHPRDEGLWVLAGRRAAAAGDMHGARGLFMRACRFCVGYGVWVEYARVEMEWLESMERKQKKGRSVQLLEEVKAVDGVDDGAEIRFDDDEEGDEELNQNGELLLANLEGDARMPKQKVFDAAAVQKLERSPALDGAIPIAIFDISLKQPFAGPEASEAFFRMFSLFITVSSQPRIVQHVLASMTELYPSSPSTGNCQIQAPLVGVDRATAAFPQALRKSLALLQTSMDVTSDKDQLAAKTVSWIEPILAADDLDVALRAVLENTKRKLKAP